MAAASAPPRRSSIDDREFLLRQVSEAAFTTQVVELARVNGWLVHHSRPALRQSGRWSTPLQGATGLPDLILVRSGRLLFAELKRQHGGKLSPFQQTWLDELATCRIRNPVIDGVQMPSVEVYIWRPGDIDEVTRILR